MLSVKLILLVIAFVLLLLEALRVQAPRVSLGWLGLASWILSLLIS